MGKVILIGGSSHSGKTTLAQILSKQLNAQLISTDQLAKHPGRPWKENPALIPTTVRNHYSSLSKEELLEDVLQHYIKVWKSIQLIIDKHWREGTTTPLVLEGSAILPDLVHHYSSTEITAFWLSISQEAYQERIFQNSNFESAALPEQQLILKFLARTLLFDKWINKEVKRLKLKLFCDLNIRSITSSIL